tara:strand:- start:121 stop:738 length:618 start_codon:yes stop_codon:yes gene_type:complete
METALPNLEAFKSVTLKARDVDLRPFLLSDVDSTYQDWLHDSETTRYLDVGFTDRSIDKLKEFVRAVEANPNRLFYMIIYRETGESIGTANLEIDPVNRLGNYGYMIGERQWWGTGVALQAQVAMFDLAFDQLGNRRFYGGARIDNIMSQFNFKRLGFVKEGVFRNHVRTDLDSETYIDVVYYGLMHEEWLAIRHKFDAHRYEDS